MSTARLVALTFIWAVSFPPGSSVNFVVPVCDRGMFDSNIDNCLLDFNRSMEASSYQERCPWPTVKSSYNALKHCVDNWATVSWCKGRGHLVDEVFLGVHLTYFTLCGQVHDPSLVTLTMLIAPGIVITLFLPLFCVHLTTWNTEMPGSLGL